MAEGDIVNAGSDIFQKIPAQIVGGIRIFGGNNMHYDVFNGAGHRIGYNSTDTASSRFCPQRDIQVSRILNGDHDTDQGSFNVIIV